MALVKCSLSHVAINSGRLLSSTKPRGGFLRIMSTLYVKCRRTRDRRETGWQPADVLNYPRRGEPSLRSRVTRCSPQKRTRLCIEWSRTYSLVYIAIAELFNHGFAIAADVYTILSDDLYMEGELVASKQLVTAELRLSVRARINFISCNAHTLLTFFELRSSHNRCKSNNLNSTHDSARWRKE